MNVPCVLCSKNLIELDAFYGELKYTKIEQQKAYTITNFFGRYSLSFFGLTICII